jgi:hypothetical protein
MAQSTKNVAAFKPVTTGGVSYAPLGTALPTDASTALSATYKSLGYVSEDGIQPSRDVSVDKVKAWGGDIVAALLTDDSQGFVFKLIEVFAAEANTFVYGTDNVTTTAASSTAGTKVAVQDTAYAPLPCILVFDMFYQGKKARVVVPQPNISITGEDPYVDGSVSGYEVTVEALKDDSGVRAYRYYENDDKTSS